MGRREAFWTKNFTPTAILFSMDNGDRITVKRVSEAIDYALGYIAQKNHITREYSMAKKVLVASKLLLNNQQCRKPSKEGFKALTDVLKEMQDVTAQSDYERVQNELIAIIIKRWIDERPW